MFNIFLPRYLGHGVIATKLRRHWEEFVPLQQEIRLTQCVTACRFADSQDVVTFYQIDWRNDWKFDISGQTRPASYAASWEAQSPGDPVEAKNLIVRSKIKILLGSTGNSWQGYGKSWHINRLFNVQGTCSEITYFVPFFFRVKWQALDSTLVWR